MLADELWYSSTFPTSREIDARSINTDNTELDDFIIMRTDGTPIYNLAVVSDDIEMKITLVLRGDDHISNTPKQVLLYGALAAELPAFAHVPLILGPDKKRLSKRHGATAVGEYEAQGYLPEAMVNFLALLGWSPGDDREVFTRAELVERFTLDGISGGTAVFNVTPESAGLYFKVPLLDNVRLFDIRILTLDDDRIVLDGTLGEVAGTFAGVRVEGDLWRFTFEPRS